MASYWDDNSMSMVDSGAGVDTSAAGSSSSWDLSNNLLSAFGTAANVYGKVAIADINANARYPQYGLGYPGGMYQQRQGALQISPVMLLLIAGAIWLAAK